MARRRTNGEGTIRQRPDGRWEAIISTGYDPETGKLKRVSFYGKTQKEVLDKATAARHHLNRGTYVDPSRLTVGAWLTEWIETYKTRRVKILTLTNYTMIVRRHLAPVLGHIALQALKADHVERYLADKAREGLEAATVLGHFRVLSQALTQAEKAGRVTRNVCRLVEAPRIQHKVRETLSMVQVREQLLAAVAADRLAAMYLTLFLTGLRRGELLGVQWQGVDLAAGTLQVGEIVERVPRQGPGATKTVLAFLEPKTAAAQRTVALPAECVTALRQHRARQAEEKLRAGAIYLDHGLLFCRTDGRPIDPRTIDRAFARVLQRAGLPPIRLHDARHTFATWMLGEEVPMKVVSDQLGHTSISITADIYSHVNGAMARQAADRLNTAFLG